MTIHWFIINLAENLLNEYKIASIASAEINAAYYKHNYKIRFVYSTSVKKFILHFALRVSIIVYNYHFLRCFRIRHRI